MNSSQHWDGHSGQWGALESPLRPNSQDVEAFEESVIRNGKTVLLGVTPELSRVSEYIIAVDSSLSMINSVWPGNDGYRQAILGDWLQTGLRSGIWDNVIGDGCPVLLQSPVQQARLFSEAARMLKQRGRLVLRCFVRPEASETIAQLKDAVLHGKAPSFHAFKWRLAMALCAENNSSNIHVRKIFDTFFELFDFNVSSNHCLPWASSAIATIDVYKNSDAIYSFPTMKELRRLVDPRLQERSCHCGDYELAQCCPLVVWERQD